MLTYVPKAAAEATTAAHATATVDAGNLPSKVGQDRSEVGEEAAAERTASAYTSSLRPQTRKVHAVSEEAAAERTATRRIVAADKEPAASWYSVYLLYWCKSTNTDAEGGAKQCARRCQRRPGDSLCSYFLLSKNRASLDC